MSAKATHIFFSKKFQHICISLDVNFNQSLTNNVVNFEQLGPECYAVIIFRILKGSRQWLLRQECLNQRTNGPVAHLRLFVLSKFMVTILKTETVWVW